MYLRGMHDSVDGVDGTHLRGAHDGVDGVDDMCLKGVSTVSIACV